MLARIFFLLLISANCFAQSGWNPVRSDNFGGYTTEDIPSIVRDYSGNLYAPFGKNVYKWTGVVWEPLGVGTNSLNANGLVTKLLVDRQNNLYATGYFTNQAGKNYVAKWNGTSWSALGTVSTYFSSSIESMVTDAANNLYVSGYFSNSSGKRFVAKWNGSAWSELGGNNSLQANDFIWAVTADKNGNIYAAGNFTNTAGERYIAKFNGSTWSELGNFHPTGGNTLVLATDSLNNVYAAGQFLNASGKTYVAKFNGSSWSELGGLNSLGATSWIRTLAADAQGRVYAGGYFVNAPNIFFGIYNGSNWEKVTAPSSDYIYTLVPDQLGNVYAAGAFENVSGNKYVSKWQRSTNTWSAVGFDGTGDLGILDGGAIRGFVADKQGNLYITGSTWSPAGAYVAKWNGFYWSPLGDLRSENQFDAITIDSSGNIYASTRTGITSAHQVYKWNGITWTQLGSGVTALNANERVYRIRADKTGNIYASGGFTNSDGKYYVAKWNGTSWAQLGPSTGAGSLNASEPSSALTVDNAGHVLAAVEEFTYATLFKIKRWDGTAWTEVRSPTSPLNTVDPIFTMAVDASGNIYAAATALNLSTGWIPYVARWDGIKWSEFGPFRNDPVNQIIAKGSDVYFANNKLIKWDGSAFVQMSSLLFPVDYIRGITFGANNQIFGTGNFRNIQSTTFYIGEMDSLFLYRPAIRGMTDVCTNSPSSRAHIANPPYNGNLTITIDGAPAPYNSSDSSFIYFTNGSTPLGNRQLQVQFSNSKYHTQIDTTFTVSNPTPLSVAISGSTVFIPNQSVEIKATSPNGGAAATYRWEDSTHAHSWVDVPGTSSSIFYYPIPGSKLRTTITSNARCLSTTTAKSNVLQFQVATALPNVIAPEKQITVFPNPVNTFAEIGKLQAGGKYHQLEIRSIDGLVSYPIIDITNRDRVRVDLGHLPSGIYIVILTGKKSIKQYYKIVRL